MTVDVRREGPVLVVIIDRPDVHNAVDAPTADALADAFDGLAADGSLRVGVLTGAHGTFCSGADLHALTDPTRRNRIDHPDRGPMGPSRSAPPKPVIAAVEGYAVAGGLELALWCDLRIVAASAVFGVFCRRIGVPLIDGGTVRLPRLIGHGRALDLILTGRPVDAEEALSIGLATQVVPDGEALDEAVALAHRLAALPQVTLRSDLASAREAFDRPLPEALSHEHHLGVAAIDAGGLDEGVRRFQAGEGRSGTPLLTDTASTRNEAAPSATDAASSARDA
jgi:enoyl-CoA hydratase